MRKIIQITEIDGMPLSHHAAGFYRENDVIWHKGKDESVLLLGNIDSYLINVDEKEPDKQNETSDSIPIEGIKAITSMISAAKK